MSDEVDPELLAELDRRRLAHESGAEPGIPAEEYFRRRRECQQDDREFDEELARRAAAINDGTAIGRPGHEVMRELRKRFPR